MNAQQPDPNRHTRNFPAQWDLSDLPKPAAPPEKNKRKSNDPAQQPAQPAFSEDTQRLFQDLQIDNYLDGENGSARHWAP